MRIRPLAFAVVLAAVFAACDDRPTEPATDATLTAEQPAADKASMLQTFDGPGSAFVLAAAISYNGEVGATSFADGLGIQGSTPFQNINDSATWEYYWMCGRAGDTPLIEVHRTTSQMDPAFTLFLGTTNDNTGVSTGNGGPNMTFLSFQDDNNGIPHGVGGSFADPQLAGFPLPATGVYTLSVYDFIGAGPPDPDGTVPFEIHARGHSTCYLAIDIKPGSWPNSINSKSKGVIPVAVLGAANFDVTDLDVTTLTFGPTGTEASPAHDLTDPFVFAKHLEDVNGDGYTDLVSHYRTQDAGFSMGDNSGFLKAEFTSYPGYTWTGSDAVRIVK